MAKPAATRKAVLSDIQSSDMKDRKAGRLREHHLFGFEAIGPKSDAVNRRRSYRNRHGVLRISGSKNLSLLITTHRL
jgi:hypothetical protein